MIAVLLLRFTNTPVKSNILLWSSTFLRKLMMTSASNVALVSIKENSFDQNKSNSGLTAYNREGNDSCPPPQIYKYTCKEQYFVVVIWVSQKINDDISFKCCISFNQREQF